MASTAREKEGRKENEEDGVAGSEKGFGWVWGVGFVRFVCPDSHKSPTFVSVLREKSSPDCLTDQYMTVLDGFRGPNGCGRFTGPP